MRLVPSTKKEKFVGKHGMKPTVTRYLTESRPGHPVAHADGRVRVHRANLYDDIGPGLHECHWCRRVIAWFASDDHPDAAPIHADHLDGNRWNNAPSNLVASCPTCNKTRIPARSPLPGGACRNGHPFTADNTYIRPDGKGRQCKECIKRRSVRRRHGRSWGADEDV